ncbi:MAG: histidine phosphatase family protein [Mollicutes bacterium]|nr:histidine phosphatase family protein [Mollicutes bacterium]
MTTIYFMRHSEPLKYINLDNKESLQIQNEKWPLTTHGENLASKKALQDELLNFDVVYSSNYIRAISTAKYFTNNTINVNAAFGERKFGINDWSELPKEFEKKQIENFNYKLKNGESLNEVKLRQIKLLEDILNKHRGKKILIVGHATAFIALFSNWCNIYLYEHNSQVFFDGKWDYCETFKLIFNKDNDLISIENIK